MTYPLRRLRTTEERFWAKVDRNGPLHPAMGTRCWLWTGHRLPNGRAYISLGRRGDGREYVHRFAFKLGHPGTALEPADKVCHRCDNPSCCNPAHLFKGTQADNIHDMLAKGRGRWRVAATHCDRGHEFSETNTRIDQRGRRSCKACAAAMQRERQARRREEKMAS